jgi:repressor LexA
MLRVRDDAMAAAAIGDGDLVVVRRQPSADPGEVVAATAGGQVRVRTFERRDGQAWLVPASPGHEEIAGEDAVILGRVVAVLRRL